MIISVLFFFFLTIDSLRVLYICKFYKVVTYLFFNDNELTLKHICIQNHKKLFIYQALILYNNSYRYRLRVQKKLQRYCGRSLVTTAIPLGDTVLVF